MTQQTREGAGGADPGRRLALGDVLRALRLAGGISQEGWAARLGVGRRTVVRWEQGDTVPDAAMAEAIIAACHEKALFRRAAITPDLLNDLLATARLAQRESGGWASSEPTAGPGTVTHGNLPAALTSFIGREAEMGEVVRQLETARLLTLTGAGGCGKTRLAIETARRSEGQYADGAWLVELASISDPEAVAAAVTATLGVREEPGRSAAELLTGFLRPRHLLLVLDNAEHLREACALLAERLLRACPRLIVLVTSRVALGVLGETVWRVPSLAAPDPAQIPVLEALSRVSSVVLFTTRARAARPGFTLTEANAAAVALICHRLDGIPLAIELAAARTSALAAKQIAARLDDRFALLTAGNRTALPRHRTLRALIDWSYDLLTPAEQRLFGRLSVFAGGFTLDAAEAVCDDREAHDAPTLDVLSSLVAHSLVLAEEASGAMRYRMLETLREYAAVRLAEHSDTEASRSRHRDYFLDLAERAAPQLRGPEQAHWMELLAQEHENLRATLRWCIEGAGGGGVGLRLATALWHFWMVRGHLTEGRAWLGEALAHGSDAEPLPRARALNALGILMSAQGDHAPARQVYEESLKLARTTDDRLTIANILANLGTVEMHAGDDAAARLRLEEALSIFRASRDRVRAAGALHNLGFLAERQGDTTRAWRRYHQSLRTRRALGDARGVAITLNNLGELALQHGDLMRARDLFNESLELRQGLHDEQGSVLCLHGLGDVARRLGDRASARSYYEQSLRIASRLGLRQETANCLEGLAAVMLAHGQAERAARVLGTVEVLRAAIAGSRLPSERLATESVIAAARDQLGDAAYASAWAAGRAMAPDEAIALALEAR